MQVLLLLKGVVASVDAGQLTLTTEAKSPEVVVLEEETKFENDGKASSVTALAPGLRVVVHLKAGSKTPTAAQVQFAAPAPVRIEVAVTADGFVVGKSPALKVGSPVTLVVTRSVEKTLATDIVLREFGIAAPLPLFEARGGYLRSETGRQGALFPSGELEVK